MTRDRVAIIDDSLTVRMDLVDAFEAAGFEVLPCASLAEARTALRATPTAIVLDVLLPDGDGVEFLRELRSSPEGAEMVVLMLSTESEVKDRVRALRTGADEYVGKPYDVDYVVAKARELLRSRHNAAAAALAFSPSVLVIDDSLTYREELKRLLESAGYSVLLATTGEEGLRLAADRRPSAIIVDGILPGVDGATVIRRIRLDHALRSTPCVLLTGADDGGAELRALDAGADAFVRKEEDADVVLARLAAVLRAGAEAPGPNAVSALGPRKILAVDDSVTYLDAIAAALRSDGYDVALARSGEEALELLGVEPVDCILLDLMMPGVGGQEACRRIKAAPVVRDIPLVMLTSVDDRQAMLDGLAAGADDFVQKSGDVEVLKARVRAQLRRKQFEDENRRMREELLRKEREAVESRAARELAEIRAVLVEQLERKNEELEAFSYSVSHDLRAPLRSIDGFSQALVEDHAGRLDARGLDYLKRVRAAAQRMGELIDDLLELSRVGRAELVRADVDLSDLACRVADELVRKEQPRSVEVVVEPNLIVEGDARLLQVVLENLIGNAFKFSAKSASPRVLIGASRDESTVYFVRDNGAGFNMAYAGRLFTPFQRLHHTTEFQGTGIGLATVQRIIARHGGRVWAEGEVGKGASVFFALPAGKVRRS